MLRLFRNLNTSRFSSIKDRFDKYFRKRRLREREIFRVLGQISENVHNLNQQFVLDQQQFSELQESLDAQSQMYEWLKQNQQYLLEMRAIEANTRSVSTPHFANDVLVSVVMPVWNREKTVRDAITSVLDQSYHHWELIIIDDGSTDQTLSVINEYSHDPRIRLFKCDHQGVCQARNLALEESHGELITYLDSDNQWVPDYLSSVVSEYTSNENISTAYAIAMVDDSRTKIRSIWDVEFNWETYLVNGGIDLNIFSHRRSLYQELGGFDPQLTRLVDWDLIARYTEQQPPKRIEKIGCIYQTEFVNRISSSESYGRNRYLLARKWQRPDRSSLRVLYVVSEYPQLTETYIRWEIECMERWGVDVHVWSERENTVTPYESDTPHYRGTLQEAMETVRPNMVHIHWLHVGRNYLETISRYAALITVRGHGYEYSSELIRELIEHPNVMGVFAFEHYLKGWEKHPKAMSTPPGINGMLYYPEETRDTQLVVRASSAKPAKDVKCFIDTALRCPRHKFVLCLGVINDMEDYADELIHYNESKGSPVEIRVNVSHEKTAELIRQCGIYMHTYGDEEPFGMPISIAEAMASGAYVLIRDLPGAREYGGSHCGYYQCSNDAATLINTTVGWYKEQWDSISSAAVESAYERFSDVKVYEQILNTWEDAVAKGVDPADVIELTIQPEFHNLIEFIQNDALGKSQQVYGRPFLTHLLGAYQQMRHWGMDKDICLAAMVHSIYDSIFIKRCTPTQENRQKLRIIIGERAEHLAYRFQTSFRQFFDRCAIAGELLPFRDRFSDEMIAFDDRDYRDLCIIHLGEWLEKFQRITPDARTQLVYECIAEQLGGKFLEDFREITGNHKVSSHQQSHYNSAA